jgi:hypothetical protein
MSAVMTGRAVTDRAPSSSDSPRDEEHSDAPASVLVEVGAGKGALVLYLEESFRDREIEISRAGVARRVHTGVLERHTAAGVVLAAVFGSLAAGPYVIWRNRDTPAASVVVVDGRVTEWTSDPLVDGGRAH